MQVRAGLVPPGTNIDASIMMCIVMPLATTVALTKVDHLTKAVPSLPAVVAVKMKTSCWTSISCLLGSYVRLDSSP